MVCGSRVEFSDLVINNQRTKGGEVIWDGIL